jgi:hypothetical protein
MGLMGPIEVWGAVLFLHPTRLSNLFISTPIITEGRKEFCFPETKKDDFRIFLLQCSTLSRLAVPA